MGQRSQSKKKVKKSGVSGICTRVVRLMLSGEGVTEWVSRSVENPCSLTNAFSLFLPCTRPASQTWRNSWARPSSSTQPSSKFSSSTGSKKKKFLLVFVDWVESGWKEIFWHLLFGGHRNGRGGGQGQRGEGAGEGR